MDRFQPEGRFRSPRPLGLPSFPSLSGRPLGSSPYRPLDREVCFTSPCRLPLSYSGRQVGPAVRSLFSLQPPATTPRRGQICALHLLHVVPHSTRGIRRRTTPTTSAKTGASRPPPRLDLGLPAQKKILPICSLHRFSPPPDLPRIETTSPPCSLSPPHSGHAPPPP